jgi:hypothetical protein
LFSVGYLLLQVTAARWAEREMANRMDFPPIRQHQFFDDYAVPVWPNDGLSVEWPPPLAVGNDLFEAFCKRFDKFTLPSWMLYGEFGPGLLTLDSFELYSVNTDYL